MTALRGFLAALDDERQASPRQAVAVCVLLIAVFLLAGMGEGPRS